MILIVSSSNSYATKRLLKEAVALGVGVKIISADDFRRQKFKVNISDYKALYIRNPYINGSAKYLPQIIKLAKQFKAAGKKVVDSNIADGILGRGKWADYQKLKKTGLPIPPTALIRGRGLVQYEFPLILKWDYGFKARNVFIIKNGDEFKKVLPPHPKKEWLVQEFIKADYEYKVITVGYKTLPVILGFKIADLGFKIDFQSYKAVKSSVVPKVAALAQAASKTLGRELAKVDILQKNNRLYILEVNRFPGLESFEKLTKFNVTKEFLRYFLKNSKNTGKIA